MKPGFPGLLMEVEIAIPFKLKNAAAPDGAPPRRIKTAEKFICRFSSSACELSFVHVSAEPFFPHFTIAEVVFSNPGPPRIRS
jgi:hypothetical protein